jgi:hypothetical protein
VPLCSPSIGETAYGSRPTGTHRPVAGIVERRSGA